jgi:predicted extracellular nuclease
LRVASFNVLNYFLTIDTTSSNDVGSCSPSRTLDCRGADSAQELSRQRSKLLVALQGLDADVLGLIEMENTPGVEPLADIVNGLSGYNYIDTGAVGTDAIRVGIIYKTATVRPVGSHAILDSSVDPRFIDTRNRPTLAQTFEEVASGARFTVVVNHLKSKGSGCGPGDDDTTTGQSNCNGTRSLAAQALADWLATDPTGSGDKDVLIIGDLNAYAKEDPIVALQNASYTNLIAAFSGPGAYSFVFDGQLGYLDHALSTPTLTPQVTGAADWHINADEIPLFDYNDPVRDSPGEASFEEESDTLPLFEANQVRTSDHDPVVVGLDLLHFDFTGFFQPVEILPEINRVNSGRAIPIKFSLSGNQGLDIFAVGYPKSEAVACEFTGPVNGMEETVTAGDSGLSYDPATDTYTYVWKTNKAWANTCRQLVVRFSDGTTQRANFNFIK